MVAASFLGAGAEPYRKKTGDIPGFLHQNPGNPGIPDQIGLQSPIYPGFRGTENRLVRIGLVFSATPPPLVLRARLPWPLIVNVTAAPARSPPPPHKTRGPTATRCFSFKVKSLHVFPHAQICIRGSDRARPYPRPPHFSLREASREARKGALPRTNGPAGVCMLPPAQQSLVFSSPPQSHGCPTRTCQQQPSPHPPQPPNSCSCKKIGSEHPPAGAYSIPVAIPEEGPDRI